MAFMGGGQCPECGHDDVHDDEIKKDIIIDLVEAVFEHAETVVGCHTCDGVLTIGQRDMDTGEEDSDDKLTLGLKLKEVLDNYI